MNKNELISKWQQSHEDAPDEFEIHTELKATHYGWLTAIITAILVIIADLLFSLLLNGKLSFQDFKMLFFALLIFCIYYFAKNLHRYKSFKEHDDLLAIIGSIFVLLISATMLFLCHIPGAE